MTDQQIQLLEETKRRYPTGTKYKLAHLPDYTAIIGNSDDLKFNDHNYIYESDGNFEKNGHNYTEVIFYNGKWADIIESPKQNTIDNYLILN